MVRTPPILIPWVTKPGTGLWADAALAATVTHNDRAAIAASVALVLVLWELLGMDSAPDAEWWVLTFCSAMRDVEGEGSRYRSRAPMMPYEGPVWTFVQDKLMQALEQRMSVRQACAWWYSGGYLLETLPSALYVLAKHGADPEEALVRAVNDTRDSDTVGAVVGALLGALHGDGVWPRKWSDALVIGDASETAAELVDRARQMFAT